MVLGIDKLHQLVKSQNLVEGLCERELKNPEGTGFDLRLGQLYKLEGKSFLGIEERKTPKTELIAKYDPDKISSFIFKPGEYYLMTTVEKVNTPSDILILFRPRTTIFRSGMQLITGNCSPGYNGKLTFGIVNLGPCEVEIELGARVVHAMFYKVSGKTNLYRGQWQNSRINMDKKEKQV